MKILKNFYIFPALAMIIIIVTVSILLSKISSDIDNIEQEYKDFLGTEILYKGDTLMVVDYHLLYSSYTLDNGVEMNKDFVDKLPVVPKE